MFIEEELNQTARFNDPNEDNEEIVQPTPHFFKLMRKKVHSPQKTFHIPRKLGVPDLKIPFQFLSNRDLSTCLKESPVREKSKTLRLQNSLELFQKPKSISSHQSQQTQVASNFQFKRQSENKNQLINYGIKNQAEAYQLIRKNYISPEKAGCKNSIDFEQRSFECGSQKSLRTETSLPKLSDVNRKSKTSSDSHREIPKSSADYLPYITKRIDDSNLQSKSKPFLMRRPQEKMVNRIFSSKQ